MFSESFFAGGKTHDLLTGFWSILVIFDNVRKQKSLQNQRFAGF